MNADCIDKLKTLLTNPDCDMLFSRIFTDMVQDAGDQDLPSATLAIPLYDENSGLKSGDYAPELHFVCRRIE